MKNLTTKLAPIVFTLGLLLVSNSWAATQTDIIGPPGSEQFGQRIYVLPNGNIVVTDPLYDAPGPIANAGAVHLYNGLTGALISTLTGSSAGNQIGYFGIRMLMNGNYVVVSSGWDNPSMGAHNDVGAVTWCSATTGCSGVISAANSLVGSSVNEYLGTITPLTNGSYVVQSQRWDHPSLTGDNNAGAVIWCNATTGCRGTMSAANSLIGASAGDNVGNNVVALTNGNFVVSSPGWDSPSLQTDNNVGAVTWGNGASGTVGMVSAINSLIGGKTNDQVGAGRTTALLNGNYVVSSPRWGNPSLAAGSNAGAATWCNGASGTVGVVTAENSLIGSSVNDFVGESIALPNGNYVVRSSSWHNPSPAWKYGVGAVTLGNGTSGTVGVISANNSLVGSSTEDHVGSYVRILTNGNYVVISPSWDNSSLAAKNDAGAITWCSATTGCSGPVSATNSLIGNSVGSNVGDRDITLLTNGNYVISTPNWDNPSLATENNAGAVTWCDGINGTTGVISASNSLIGASAGDKVGIGDVIALTNGSYVVSSPYWDNPISSLANVGAVTWGSGASGIVGIVSPSNSLIGDKLNDMVGVGNVAALTNGNYVVSSFYWDNPSLAAGNDAGAATWSNGTSGLIGVVSASNSLIGDKTDDQVGGAVVALTNGNYVINGPFWDNPALAVNNNAGAVTWGNGASGTIGVVSANNSLVGGSLNDSIGIFNSTTNAYGITALTNDSYVVRSHVWDNPAGSITDAGAISYGLGSGGTIGLITAANSVRGTTAGGGSSQKFVFDAVNNQLVVGRPFDNIVTLFKLSAGPTAAEVSISGRAITTAGRGIKDARLTLTDKNGNSRIILTGIRGFYQFDNVAAGETYIITAAVKRFAFNQPTQVLNITENISDLNFVGNAK